jgi:hypothetical protein
MIRNRTSENPYSLSWLWIPAPRLRGALRADPLVASRNDGRSGALAAQQCFVADCVIVNAGY